MRVPEGEEGQKNYSRRNCENFPGMMKNTDLNIQVQWTPNRKNERTNSRHIVVKMLKVKDKEKILKATEK